MVINRSNHIARIISVIALLGGSAAHSDIISSDIQPGDLFGPGIAIGLVPFVGVFNYAGIGFTPSQDFAFDSTELAISLSSGPNVLNVYLMGSRVAFQVGFWSLSI